MIERLDDLDPDQVRRVIVGYESDHRYAVTKTEGANRVSFTLELREGRTSKRFDTSDETVDWYRKALVERLSFGAFESGELVGLTIAQPQRWNATCIVWELHVQEAARHKGYGRGLLRHVEDAALGQRLRRVWIETQVTNVPAIAFYRACGYEVGGIDIGHYSNEDRDTGEIAVFMQKAVA